MAEAGVRGLAEPASCVGLGQPLRSAWSWSGLFDKRRGHLLAAARWSDPYHAVSLRSAQRLLFQRQITLPSGAEYQAMAVSRQGDRIAWQLGFTDKPAVPRWLCRLLPFLKRPESRRISLWVSRLDGSGMREVGSTPVESDLPGPPFVGELRWLPSGKTLSFVTQGYEDSKWTVRLYTVPAE